MSDITICPFCLTIYLYTEEVGDECPTCEIGILESLDEHTLRTSEQQNDE